MKKDIANRLRLLRLSRNMSQENLADELGITIGAYSNIERGVTDITITRLKQIVDIFGIDIKDVLTSDNIIRENEPPYLQDQKRNIEDLKDMVRRLEKEIKQIASEVKKLKEEKN